MPHWAVGVIIRAINRCCLYIAGILFVFTFGRALAFWPFWAFVAFAWVGFLAEWGVEELRQAMDETLRKQLAASGDTTSNLKSEM